MSKSDWREINSLRDTPGIQALAALWKSNNYGEDPLLIAQRVVSRRRLAYSLMLVDLLLLVLFGESVFYTQAEWWPFSYLSDNPRFVFWGAVFFAAFVWVAVRDHSGSSFVTYLYDGNNPFSYPKSFSAYTLAELKSHARKTLVGKALAVLELEKENEAVPIEHWGWEKKYLTKDFERMYKNIFMFGLSSGGYGPYYAEARKKLAAAA